MVVREGVRRGPGGMCGGRCGGMGGVGSRRYDRAGTICDHEWGGHGHLVAEGAAGSCVRARACPRSCACVMITEWERGREIEFCNVLPPTPGGDLCLVCTRLVPGLTWSEPPGGGQASVEGRWACWGLNIQSSRQQQARGRKGGWSSAAGQLHDDGRSGGRLGPSAKVKQPDR